MNFNKHNLKVGTLITAYRKGYHRVVSIRQRFATESDVKQCPQIYKFVGEEYSPIVEYAQVLSATYKVIKSKCTYECDMAYCQPVTLEKLDEMVQKYIAGLDLLKKEIEKKV